MKPGDTIEIRAGFRATVREGWTERPDEPPADLRELWLTATIEEVRGVGDTAQIIVRFREPDTGADRIECVRVEPRNGEPKGWRWPDPSRKN